MNDQQEKIGNVKTDFEQKLSAINSSMKSLHSKVAEATEKVNEVKTLADENALAVVPEHRGTDRVVLLEALYGLKGRSLTHTVQPSG